MTDFETFAYKLGGMGYRIGKGTSDNPYKRASKSWWAWNRGYSAEGGKR